MPGALPHSNTREIMIGLWSLGGVTQIMGGLRGPKVLHVVSAEARLDFHFSGNSKNETKKSLCCLALLGFFFIPGQHKRFFFGFAPT